MQLSVPSIFSFLRVLRLPASLRFPDPAFGLPGNLLQELDVPLHQRDVVCPGDRHVHFFGQSYFLVELSRSRFRLDPGVGHLLVDLGQNEARSGHDVLEYLASLLVVEEVVGGVHLHALEPVERGAEYLELRLDFSKKLKIQKEYFTI